MNYDCLSSHHSVNIKYIRERWLDLIYMAKRREILDESKIEKYIKMGYGSGEGKEYKPWIEIQDFPSLGRVSRPFGWKTNRIHHLLSDLEKKYFYLFEWSDIVVDIREQFPLFNRELAIEIAKEKDIKYPVFKGTNIPYIMTTDFMITIRAGTGQLEHIARTVKPSGDLEKKSVIEKYEIERSYWERKGINWGLVTENEINDNLASNIEWIHLCYRYEDLEFNDRTYFTELVNVLVNRLYKSDIPLSSLLSNLDFEYNAEPGTFLKIFKHLIATKVIQIDLMQKINLNYSVKDIILTGDICGFKEMKA